MKPIKYIQDAFFSTKKTHYAFIDGAACPTLDKAYHKLQEQLSFPDYFSQNLDSLDELLSDLEWISKPRIRLIIADLPQILNEEDLDRKESFLEVINEHQNERLEVIYIGKASA